MNLCETYITVIVWLLSVCLLFRAVTVCIRFSLSPVGFCQFCFSTDHHGDLQRISCRMGVCCFLWCEKKKMWERREERKRRGLRGGGGAGCCGVVVVLCCVVVWWCEFVCCTTNFYQGCVHSPYSFCSFIPAKHGWEELAHHVVGNESGTCKAGFAGDDADGRKNLATHTTKHSFTMQGSWLADWQLSLDSVDGGVWPFDVGGVICLVTSVSVCTEKDGKIDREKEERRTWKRELPPNCGLTYRHFFLFYPPNRRLTYRQKRFFYSSHLRNRHFFFATRLTAGTLNEKRPS